MAGAASEGDNARPLLADELVDGGHYRVVVTTARGLYRYQLHDEVEVAGFDRQVPLLRFVGKSEDVCDLVGEKLHAAHVEGVMQAAFRALGLRPTFAQLCGHRSSQPRYVLQLVEPELGTNPALHAQLCQAVEDGLEANPGYRYARAVGQLQPLKIELINQHEADEVTQGHVEERVAMGHRFGNIKPVTLRG